MSTKLKIQPLDNRVVVERLEEDEKSAGGILIPDHVKEKPMRGVVLAVGAGKRADDGKRSAMDVKVGDKILFGKYAGTEFKLDNKEYLIMREDDIIAIITG